MKKPIRSILSAISSNALAVVTLFALTTTFFCSCEKEGVYKPEKKISNICKIYDNSSPKCQYWEWDGDLVKSITSDNSITFFYYKGRQLTDIVSKSHASSDDFTHYEFKYDKSGRHIVTIDKYFKGRVPHAQPNQTNYVNSPVCTGHWDFFYNKEGQISGYQEKLYYIEKDENEVMDYISKYVIPIYPTWKIMKSHENDSKGPVLSTQSVASFTYTDNNITEIRISDGASNYVAKYVYSDYPNPFYKFFHPNNFTGWMIQPNSFTGAINKQLPLSFHSEEKIPLDGTTFYYYYYDCDYSYEMEDGYPIATTESGKGYYYSPTIETPDTSYSKIITNYEYLP